MASVRVFPFSTGSAGGGSIATGSARLPDVAQLREMTARYAPADIGTDIGGLPQSERRALVWILEAARVMDPLFLLQVWAGNPALESRLAADGSPLGRARHAYFVLNKGPWSRLDDHEAFVPGVPVKPKGANFYPADATKAAIEAWLETLPEHDRRRATGFFTVIRRGPDGCPMIIPYHLEYQDLLKPAVQALRQAVALTLQPSLERYLTTRARALETDDFLESDVAWMELDAAIEPVIGPYEVYEDEWCGGCSIV